LGKKVLPRPRYPGPFLAIAADRAVDEARIEHARVLETEPQPLDDAGAEVLDEHVGAGDQLPQGPHVALALQVYGKALLGAVDGMEDGGIAALRVAEIKPAREIAALRPLDLDDAGAEIHQPQRAIGAGQELAHVHDQKAAQRQFVLLRHGNTPP
jgi:hypothetical protein